MKVYRVRHRARGDSYFVMMTNPQEALEKVTLQLANVEGSAAWQVDECSPSFSLVEGVVFDNDGKEMKPVEL